MPLCLRVFLCMLHSPSWPTSCHITLSDQSVNTPALTDRLDPLRVAATHPHLGLSGDPTDPTAVCQMLSPEDTEVTQLAPSEYL